MHGVRLALAGFLACALTFEVSAQTPPQLPPVEAFGNLPFASQPTLSRTGQYLATIQSVLGRPTGAVYDLNAGKPPVPLPTGDWILAGLRWAPDDRLILFLKQNAAKFGGLRTSVRLMAVDPDGRNAVTLMSNLPDYGLFETAYIIDVNAAVADQVLIGIPNRLGRIDAFTVDLKTGAAAKAVAGQSVGGQHTTRWYTDGHGAVVARIDVTEDPWQEHLLLPAGEKWTEAAVFDASEDNGAGVQGITEDGLGLVMVARDAERKKVLVRLDLATRKIAPLFSVPAYDIGGAIVDQWSGRVVGAAYVDDRPQTRFFAADREATQLGVEKAFPGLSVTIVSENEPRERVVLNVEGPQFPPTYFYLNRTTHQATLIGKAYPDLSPSDLGEMKPYPYKARDGVDIPAYITLPPGKTAKNLPAVVMPHGGPDARDYIHFDWWAQFLANRGYVVLQPNFRGSTGFGHEFTTAGLHQWGLKMQDDISDGVARMIADGIVDPKRVCIVGASYGGYAALAGATFTPDLYACAVTWAAVSDLPRVMASEKRATGGDSRAVSFWTSRIGSLDGDMPRLIATSPARNASKVKCPILLMHGEGDTTVRIDQSELEETALREAGKKVTFVRFSGGEDHYMNYADTRVRVLKETEKFLKDAIGD